MEVLALFFEGKQSQFFEQLHSLLLLYKPGDRLRTARNFQFLENILHITFDRHFGQSHGSSDFLVSFAFCDQWQDFLFLKGQSMNGAIGWGCCPSYELGEQ
jgi:hypothetical protein